MQVHVHAVSKYDFMNDHDERVNGVKIFYLVESDSENILGEQSVFAITKDMSWFDYFKKHGVPAIYDMEFVLVPGKTGPKLKPVSLSFEKNIGE